MSEKQYVPIDLPRELTHLLENFPDEAKETVARITEERLSNGRWDATEDVPFDPNDIEFIAYWLHKTRAPLRKAKQGSGIEQKLEPYRKSHFDLTPPGFVAESTQRLSAVGDLMFAKHIEESRDRLYEPVRDLIFGADCAFANLESTLTSEEPKEFGVTGKGDTPYINITPNQYDSLVKHKGRQFDIVHLANNHILDCGEEGVATTLEQLRRDNIEFAGVYETLADSRAVKTTRVGGIKIGWVAHTFSVNFKPLPENKPWICDITPFHVEPDPDTSRIERQIARAREAGCDLVVLSLHWGLEHEFYPHPDQLQWAHRFADAGADAIIGHHPHVIQFPEIYRPQGQPEKRVPILYSLGNLTPAYSAPFTVLSLVANLRIARGSLFGEPCTRITGLDLTPVVFMGAKDESGDFASIVPLDVLLRSELDSATGAYVEEIREYADFVLGPDRGRQPD